MVSARLLAGILVAVLVPGCLVSRDDSAEPISGWPPGQGGRRSIRVVVTGEKVVNDRRVTSTPVKGVRESVVETYRESGLFSEVVTEPVETDLVARVKIETFERYSEIMRALCIGTITIVPVRIASSVKAETTVTDRSGRVLGTWMAADSVTTWIEFLLIFAAPFTWPGTVDEAKLHDPVRRTVLEAHAAGAF